MNEKIILIEDDAEIRRMIEEYLEASGFEMTSFEDGSSFIRCIGNFEGYSLILIDLMLPDISGMELIKRIRSAANIPIIIITAKDSDQDKTLGFGLGADDYVVKPFSLIELAARIKANIRRAKMGSSHKQTLHLRDLCIDPKQYAVFRAGVNLKLTRTEFDILYLLAAHPDKAFSKEQVYEAVWKAPYYGDENVINTHVNRLRAKLKANGGNAEYIKTLWGIGYKVSES